MSKELTIPVMISAGNYAEISISVDDGVAKRISNTTLKIALKSNTDLDEIANYLDKAAEKEI